MILGSGDRRLLYSMNLVSGDRRQNTGDRIIA